jgi:hypothetical protein
VPIAGVELYCESCIPPDGHTFRFTDANGRYSFTGTTSGTHLVQVATARGYTLRRPDRAGPTGWVGGVNAVVSGDTVFDIELVRQ